MRFVVFGAGAVGGVVGGRLVQAGFDVVLIARGAHGEEMARHGLRLHSPDDVKRVDVRVVDHPSDVGLTADDVVLLTVKSQNTVEALDRLSTAAGPSLPIVCLQNGVNNEREALRRFDRVYGATVMCPTVHLEPGHVLAYSSPMTGIIDVGRFPTGVDENAAAVAQALESSTFSSLALPDVARWKWAKLITNLGNAIEAVCGPPARGGPIGDLVRAEAEAVLDRAGIDYATAAEDRARRGDWLQIAPVDGVARPGGSTWQSLARVSGSVETDYLNGEIVMLGRLHGVPTPANEALRSAAVKMAAAGSPPGATGEEDFLAGVRRAQD